MALVIYHTPKQQALIEKLKKQADKKGWSLSKYVMSILEKEVK